MAVFLSPGVNFTEIDLTTIVPAVSISTGALSGVFRWGPVGERFLVDSENTLTQYFGNPTSYNAETFFTAANFLAYTNQLYVVRAANTIGRTPYGEYTATANSNIFVGNTFYIQDSMYISQVGDATILPYWGNSVSVSTVNSSAFTLNEVAANDGVVELYFACPETSYSSLATEPQGVVTNLANQIVKNESDYYARQTGVWTNGVFTVARGAFDPDVLFIAKYPGAMGNSLRIGFCDNPTSYNSNIDLSTAILQFNIGSDVAMATFSGVGNAAAANVVNDISIGDQIVAGNSSIGFQYCTVTQCYVAPDDDGTDTDLIFQFVDPYRLHTAYQTTVVNRFWEFFNVVGYAPGQSDWVLHNGNTSAMDEVHIVIVDDGGAFTGTPGTVLEAFKGLSRATDAKNADGSLNYFANVINQNSAYVWYANDRSTAPSANAFNVITATSTAPGNYPFQFGTDGYDEQTVTLSTIGEGYQFFVSPEDIDIGIVLQGYPGGEIGATWQLANYLIQNIAEVRRDCVVCCSPDKNIILNQYGNEAMNMVQWVQNVEGSNYGIMDSGYKYQYDRYSDLYRWIPLNGDIGGLMARTDQTNDPWWSPAGLNRGLIKNSVKLSWNPKQADRDVLYPHNVNPVITIPGTGTLLYGDKTLQAKSSAFDRINVRRLFIVLEKAICLASKYLLFEFNDAFTQNQFKNMVNPFLRSVQGRRGIQDFLVVCDSTNNTAQIIDANQFVGDIYIKPARSINFIQLNFVAVPTGVAFTEVVRNW